MRIKKTENLLYLMRRNSGPTIIDLNKEIPLYIEGEGLTTWDTESNERKDYRCSRVPAEFSREFGKEWFQTWPGSGVFVNPDAVDWDASHMTVSRLSPKLMLLKMRYLTEQTVVILRMSGYEKFFPETPQADGFFFPGTWYRTPQIWLKHIWQMESRDYGRTISRVYYTDPDLGGISQMPVEGDLIAPLNTIRAGVEADTGSKMKRTCNKEGKVIWQR